MSSLSSGISQREFARREGCDPKLIQRAVKSGHLPTLSDGTLDPDLVGSGWRKRNRRGEDSGEDSAAVSADMSSVSSPPVLTTLEPQTHGGGLKRRRRTEEPDEVIDGDQFVAEVMSGKVHKLADSERVKEGALALKQVLAARQAAGQLVELAVAEAVLFETARAARDSWLNWPARVGPLLAADLGVPADRVTEVLTAHVQSHLADLGEPEADFNPKSS